MLAGAVVTLADFVLIFLHDALKFATDNSQGGEGIMELPGWLAVVSLMGALLGGIGAAGSAALGGRILPAERGRTVTLPRRILVTASALARFRSHSNLNGCAGVAYLSAKSPRTGRGEPAVCRWNRTAGDCLERPSGRCRVCCRGIPQERGRGIAGRS